MPADTLASQVSILVDGDLLSPDIQNSMIEVVVEQHAHLPGMFLIAFAEDRKLSILESATLDLTKEIEIKCENEAGTDVSLIKGEITSLEPRFQAGMTTETVVLGYDKSHRLYRETRSTAYLNIKDSDLANQFAGNAGLSAQVDATSTVYDALYQDNQTDLEFLKQRAWRIGYECFVKDGKLYFRKPPTSGTTVKLTWGEDLIEFHPRASLAEQVSEVNVRGWDIQKVEAIVGQATTSTLYPTISLGKGGDKAESFGTGKRIVVDQPVLDQAEANKMAEARLDELSGAFVTATGIALRKPEIRAGDFVELNEIGTRFSGKYLVTSARHSYSPGEGMLTEFSVRGTRSGLLFDQLAHQSPVEKWGGVVPAIVTDTDDPNQWARVKVKFPWMTDDAESDWARVVSPGAGTESGFCLVPEVGDEVIVAFEHGDINHPYVLGGVWNGNEAIPGPVSGAGSGEVPLVRSWRSTNGNEISIYDNADKKIEILTAEGHRLVFDDTNKLVELTTSGGHKILLDDQAKKIEITDASGNSTTMEASGVKISSVANLDLESTGMMKLKGTNVEIDGGPAITIKGGMVNIN